MSDETPDANNDAELPENDVPQDADVPQDEAASGSELNDTAASGSVESDTDTDSSANMEDLPPLDDADFVFSVFV